MLPANVFVHLHISKLHSIILVANLLAHNYVSRQICYYVQISLHCAVVNCSFSGNPIPLGETFIWLAMVHLTCSIRANL